MHEAATKRMKLTHELFHVPKFTMRESIVRVLEQKIDPSLMIQLDNQFDFANLSSDDEGAGGE